MDCTPPDFQGGDRVYFKNKQPGKWDLKWRARYRIGHIEYDVHTSILKIRPQERPDHVMSRMLYMNHQLSYGILKLNLTEQESL